MMRGVNNFPIPLYIYIKKQNYINYFKQHIEASLVYGFFTNLVIIIT